MVETAGDETRCSGWPAVSYVSHCALFALHDALLDPPFFLPVEPVEWFHPRSLPGPVFFNVGRQALPHQGWVCGQSVLLLDGLPVKAIELHLPGF